MKYDWSNIASLYLEKGLSTTDIAKAKHCSTTAVQYALKKRGIARRNMGEAIALCRKHGRGWGYIKYNGRKWDGYPVVKLNSSDFFFPMCDKAGYVAEHRLVMAKFLGRNLHPWEVVHHKNGTKTDNRMENLALVMADGHQRLHVLQLFKENESLRKIIEKLERRLGMHNRKREKATV